MTSSGSLRDLYSSPSSSWSFIPPQPNSSSATATSSSIPKHEWSTRHHTSPVFDLSPSFPLERDGINVDLGAVLKGLLASELVQYTGTALVMPWAVGKILLQIQWIPRDAESLESDGGRVVEEDELSDDSSDVPYFHDPASSMPSRYHPPKPRLADGEGYIARLSVSEEDTRPEYVMPIGKTKGVWGMIQKVARWKNEGWLALWKGLLTSYLTNTASLVVQPLIQDTILLLFPSYPTSPPPFLVPFASHVLTGILLSPLDLVRTRLIAQSSLPRHRTYTGPLNALSEILQHEGGLPGVYLHPHLLIPAALHNAARPFVNLALPSLLATRLGVNEDSHPAVWAVTELTAGCLSSLITTPIETVRRRLQVQTRGTGKFKACVETRPRPYHGVVDTVWRIVTEERSDIPISSRKTRGKSKERVRESTLEVVDEGWVTFGGVGQLYHGLSMNIGAVLVASILAAVVGGQEAESGWAEL
ncbi:mitochondrial carrier domain-containing protein [Gautieria morchelliformis]|nr:mitochondrial carrier domain-containing protein [Gautieria morchelliformis]